MENIIKIKSVVKVDDNVFDVIIMRKGIELATITFTLTGLANEETEKYNIEYTVNPSDKDLIDTSWIIKKIIDEDLEENNRLVALFFHENEIDYYSVLEITKQVDEIVYFKCLGDAYAKIGLFNRLKEKCLDEKEYSRTLRGTKE